MTHLTRKMCALATMVLLGSSACRHAGDTAVPAATMSRMDALAISYVRLALAAGEHDGDFVDAYYGPPAWREEAKAAKKSLADIQSESRTLLAELSEVPASDKLQKLRKDNLQHQIVALRTRLDIVQGKKLPFDEESRLLYDAIAPRHDAAYYEKALAELDRALPGSGSLIDRVETFRSRYVIPSDKLDTVFRAAVEGCRARTEKQIELPPGESFTIEYVKNKSWSGYNWYQGNYKSLIQVNTDLPIFIDRAVDLACHEGYPGHHVYNVLLEKNLVNDRNWVEFTVYPLFSPQSLIAEGSANYGIDVAFPGDERGKFERDVLYPLAGLDPSTSARYDEVQGLLGALAYAGNEAARRYLDGEISADQARDWLTRYALMAPERAKQRIQFMEKYRSYVINYNLGKDLVGDWIERNGGTASNPERRWRLFRELLSWPKSPSSLKE